jgi:hypothetical protein
VWRRRGAHSLSSSSALYQCCCWMGTKFWVLEPQVPVAVQNRDLRLLRTKIGPTRG